jgi:hypothetical protein
LSTALVGGLYIVLSFKTWTPNVSFRFRVRVCWTIVEHKECLVP